MQESTRPHRAPSIADYALAIALHREEQKQMDSMVEKVLGRYGKPTMSLKKLRAILDDELGSKSLSHEIIKMRDEGY